MRYGVAHDNVFVTDHLTLRTPCGTMLQAMPNAAPQKNPSIEDLFKTSAAPKPAAQNSGFIAGSSNPIKNAATKPKPRQPPSQKERLTEKMSTIKLAELEKEAKQRAGELDLPYLNLTGFPIASEALALIPPEEASRVRTIAFLKLEDELRVATPDEPTPEVNAIAKRLAEQEHANVQIYFVSEPSFEAALKLYDALPDIPEISYGLKIDEASLQKYEKETSSFGDLQERISRVSTTDVITLMLGAALKHNASDIHIEAEEEGIKIRLRVDGVLQDAAVMPKDAWRQMIGRLKLLAGVKINVENVPQDGHITIYLTSEKIEIRASFLPTAFGESVVMRLLRPKSVALEFDQLGVRGNAWEQLQREIRRPNGMIVTTGPTGSGKTTTLYAVLKKLNTSDVKIITLEDPVEYKLPGINQSQVDYSKDYDFAKGLRSILRQDPDIVMVGEIRDLETAEISIQAALTGHLVVSTLHTNSAAAAIPRFLSMGVKPFLLAPAVNAIMAQRLVRRLCQTCKESIELEPELRKKIQTILAAIPKNSGVTVDTSQLRFYEPSSAKTATCDDCNGLGYRGRIGIYEILVMSKDIEKIILSGNVSEYQMAELAANQGMITMVQDGLLKALDGITSVEEVMRVADSEITN